jgi:hypothetical protein
MGLSETTKNSDSASADPFAQLLRPAEQLVPDHEIAELGPEVALLGGDGVVTLRIQPGHPGLTRRLGIARVQPGHVAIGFQRGDVGIRR